MSLRLSLAALCIVCAAGLGFLKGQRLRTRIRMLERMARLLLHMERELEFGREPLPQIFQKLSEKNDGRLKLFLKKVSKEMTTGNGEFRDIFSKNIQQCLEGGELTGEDIKRLYAFGNELGYPDRQLQIHAVAVFRKETEMLLEELKKEYPQSCRLFRTLWTAAGVFLAILLW